MAQTKGKYCSLCRRNVLSERPEINHILHFLITFCTCGLWAFVWMGLAIRFGGWKCTVCGSKV